MKFGLNRMRVNSLTKYRGGSFALHFQCRDHSVPLYISKDADRRLVANLKYAFGIEGNFSLEGLGDKLWSIDKEVWVFLHYHSEVPQGRQITFLHIPGTIEDGAVFDMYDGTDYLQYEDNGGIVYKVPSSGKTSIVKRSSEYMKGPNVRPKGTIVKG
jgi:hypothetical protein